MTISEAPLVMTKFGWGTASFTPPSNRDMFWMKMPEKHTYGWDGDGWYRLDPPEPAYLPDGDLNHG